MPEIKQKTTIANVSAAAFRIQNGPRDFIDAKPKIYHCLLSELVTYKQGVSTPYQIISLLNHKINSHTFQIKNQVVN